MFNKQLVCCNGLKNVSGFTLMTSRTRTSNYLKINCFVFRRSFIEPKTPDK